MVQNDTDTLLALLVSILPPPVPAQSVLLDALVDCEGDVQAAARALRSKKSFKGPEPRTKRKRSAVDLDGWLLPPESSRRDSSTKRRTASPKPRQRTPVKLDEDADAYGFKLGKISIRSPSTSSSKETLDLKAVLRPPPSAGPSIPRPPPLTLTNPTMIAQHVPCTLHPSVLPQELACQLFYTMIDASESWSRNKWWLFDRVVESPHRTSFFVRKSQFNDKQTWQEAAQFW